MVLEWEWPLFAQELVMVEEWEYNLHSNRFIRHLRFENGRLIKINERDYGYSGWCHAAKTSNLAKNLLRLGKFVLRDSWKCPGHDGVLNEQRLTANKGEKR